MKPALPDAHASHPTLHFVHRGQVRSVSQVPPDRTLLALLRDDLGLTSVKEGCAEGDCGACTVVLAEAQGQQVAYKAVNSCIRLAHSVQGQAVWTAQDLTLDPLLVRQNTPQHAHAPLHPAQQALVDCHGSQCGFCTPGFVMSLFGLYQNRVCAGQAVDRETARAALSGNLCRCTGYRPILDAAQAMAEQPPVRVDETHLRQLLRQARHAEVSSDSAANNTYLAPATLPALLQARARHPGAQVVAGTTDVGLWITKGQQRYPRVLDVTQTAELRRVEHYPHHIAIGSAVTLTNAFAALAALRPELATFAERFASLPVRNAGTLGGNVVNGSPIGDSMPLLLALGASLVLMRWQGTLRRGRIAHRELALEDFYTGYRRNQLRPDELLAWIKVPKPVRPLHAPLPAQASGEWTRVYKVSKRREDDIAAVCLAVSLHLKRGVVQSARLGAGGVAATPVRAPQTETALTSQPWNAATVQNAVQVLEQEFQPLSDHRASADYRRQVLANLLWRCWLESQHPLHTELNTMVTVPLDLAGLEPLP